MQPIKGLSLIVAMTPDRIIGSGDDLPWHLPSDQKRFKNITTEIGTIIVGRRTHEIICHKHGTALRGRRSIVLTRHPQRRASRVDMVTSIEEAVALCGGRACVAGGGDVYRQFLPLVETVYLTFVYAYAPIRGDAFFPKMDQFRWWCAHETEKRRQHGDQYPTSFVVLQRRSRNDDDE